RLMRRVGAEGWAEAADGWAARSLAGGLVRLGPMGIKLGQTLSTRVDVLPRAWRKPLVRLQDDVPAEDAGVALGILRQELGDAYGRVLVRVDPVPVASASIAQVHRGWLAEGRQVAVKIQRPGLQARLAVDGPLLLRTARGLERLAASLGPVSLFRPRRALLHVKDLPYESVAKSFLEGLHRQLDFLAEATQAERFLENFKGFEGILAPRPHRGLTTRRVLVMEWIDGVKFHDLAGIAALGVDFRKPVRRGVEAFVKQILEDGFFHADTHPGNILVTADGDVAYLDWGLTDTFPEDLKLELVSCFLDVVRADWAGLTEGLIRLGMFPPTVDRGRLIPLLAELVDIQIGRKGDRMLPLAEVLERLASMLEDQPFRLPERLTALMRTAATMEGLVLETWPEFKFLEVALPFAARLLLTGQHQNLRRRLIDEWLPEGRLDLDRVEATVAMASRERPVAVASFLPEALAWLVCGEGRPLRDALVDAAWPEVPEVCPPEAAERLAILLQRNLSLAGTDVVATARAVAPWLACKEGQDWLGQLLRRWARQPDPDPLLRAMALQFGTWVPQDPWPLLKVLTPLATEVLGRDRAWWGKVPAWSSGMLQHPDVTGSLLNWARAFAAVTGEPDASELVPLLEAIARSPLPVGRLTGTLADVLVARPLPGWPDWRFAMQALLRLPPACFLAIGRILSRPDVTAALALRMPKLARWALVAREQGLTEEDACT
ncbi:MAG: AarF/UbiB family protein, partial [Candidatus Sericytochromatia bacterium]|nr:AarF/UbiB family protein [Candidatus Sericytochromatia bacterium]